MHQNLFSFHGAALHTYGVLIALGFLIGIVLAGREAKRLRLPPSLAIAHFFGRLGCYAAGCCWGKVCHLAWGARFPRSSLAFEGLSRDGTIPAGANFTPPLHPTQLYEALAELAIFTGLVVLR